MNLLRTLLAAIDVRTAKAAALGRRQFLRLTAIGVSLPAASAALSACGSDSSGSVTTVTAFRLSTRRMRVCGACKAHAANRFYRTSDAADADRAHAGCNCRIVVHPIARNLADEYFRDGDAYDKRWSA